MKNKTEIENKIKEIGSAEAHNMMDPIKYEAAIKALEWVLKDEVRQMGEKE